MAQKTIKGNSRKKQVELNREYRRKEKFLVKIGARSEKAPGDLTRKQKSNINAAYKKWAEFDAPEFLPIKINKTTQEKREIRKLAADLEIPATRTHLIVEKSGQRRGSIKFNSKNKEYEIHLRGKVRWGENVGKKVDTLIPLSPQGTLEKEEARLRAMAENLGPLGKNDRLTFKVVENGNTGFSKMVYGDADLLMSRLWEYDKKPSARINFFRHVIVEKTTPIKWAQVRRENRSAREIRKSENRKAARERKKARERDRKNQK